MKLSVPLQQLSFAYSKCLFRACSTQLVSCRYLWLRRTLHEGNFSWTCLLIVARWSFDSGACFWLHLFSMNSRVLDYIEVSDCQHDKAFVDLVN